MKTVLTFLFCILILFITAQNITLPTDFDSKITYTDVVEITDIKKDSLLKNAKLFLKKNVSISDVKEEDGVITAKGYEDFIGGAKKIKMKMTFDITIEFKDGKYKYTITNVLYRPYPDNMNPSPMPIDADELYAEYRLLIAEGKESNKTVKNSNGMFAITDREIKEFIDELEKNIKNPVVDEEDW